MFILIEWTVLNMFDWVETPVVVSESKERLAQYYAEKYGRAPLVDSTVGDDLEHYCARRNKAEGREGNSCITEGCFDCYYSIDTIDHI